MPETTPSQTEIPQDLLSDRYWGSLLLLFRKQPKLRTCFRPEFIDLPHRTVHAKSLQLRARPWSKSERLMLNLALHLFNERNKVNLSDMDYLDYENKALAMQAIEFRFGVGT